MKAIKKYRQDRNAGRDQVSGQEEGWKSCKKQIENYLSVAGRKTTWSVEIFQDKLFFEYWSILFMLSRNVLGKRRVPSLWNYSKGEIQDWRKVLAVYTVVFPVFWYGNSNYLSPLQLAVCNPGVFWCRETWHFMKKNPNAKSGTCRTKDSRKLEFLIPINSV